jgi:hypothetical protein
MAERRPLIAGLKPTAEVAPEVEKEFVHGKKAEPAKPHAPAGADEGAKRPAKARDTVSRLPLTTRIRADYAAALKRASLERQLAGEVPNTLQDILEEALEPWLRKHGYVK